MSQYIEFTDRLERVVDVPAVKLKLTQDFLTESGEVPFSNFGDKIDSFQLTNASAWTIQEVLNRYGVISDFVMTGGRLVLTEANIVVNLAGTLNQQSQ